MEICYKNPDVVEFEKFFLLLDVNSDSLSRRRSRHNLLENTDIKYESVAFTVTFKSLSVSSFLPDFFGTHPSVLREVGPALI